MSEMLDEKRRRSERAEFEIATKRASTSYLIKSLITAATEESHRFPVFSPWKVRIMEDELDARLPAREHAPQCDAVAYNEK